MVHLSRARGSAAPFLGRLASEPRTSSRCWTASSTSITPRCSSRHRCFITEVLTSCDSGVCNGSGACVPPTCVDGRFGEGETDTDCGGAACQPCGKGQICKAASDCESGYCVDGVCCDTPCDSSCVACMEGKTGVAEACVRQFRAAPLRTRSAGTRSSATALHVVARLAHASRRPP